VSMAYQMAAKKDFTQIALDVVRRATGEVTAPTTAKKKDGGRNVVYRPAKAPKKRPKT
jgi:hypothetical protein